MIISQSAALYKSLVNCATYSNRCCKKTKLKRNHVDKLNKIRAAFSSDSSLLTLAEVDTFVLIALEFIESKEVIMISRYVQTEASVS